MATSLRGVAFYLAKIYESAIVFFCSSEDKSGSFYRRYLMILNRVVLEEFPEPSFERALFCDVNPLSGLKKRRVIYMPNPAMKSLHKRFLVKLRPLLYLPFATGAVPRGSARANVVIHRNSRYFYITDLRDAFLSVDDGRLLKVLTEIDPEESRKDLGEFIRRFCIAPGGGLYVGSPSSPDLFNVYAGHLIDVQLGELCARYGIIYTRYLDDLVFSSGQAIGKRKRRAIREIIYSAGFEVNQRKSRVCDLRQAPIKINGIGLEYGGRIFVPRQYTRRTMGLILRARATRDRKLLQKIQGRMGLFFGITCGKGRHRYNKTELRLIRAYDKLRWDASFWPRI